MWLTDLFTYVHSIPVPSWGVVVPIVGYLGVRTKATIDGKALVAAAQVKATIDGEAAVRVQQMKSDAEKETAIAVALIKAKSDKALALITARAQEVKRMTLAA